MASFPGQKGTGPIAAPPTVPQNLTANASSSSEIDLTWSASTDNGGPGLKFYNIYRNGLVFTSTTNLTYQDTGLNPSTLYTYNVSAVDKNRTESALSSPASATTLAAPSATVQQDQPITLVGSGFGIKSQGPAPRVWDNCTDGTAFGSTSPQWTGTSKFPALAGGIYNVQNQPPYFSPTGWPVGSATRWAGGMTSGCHLYDSSAGVTLQQDSSTVALNYAWQPPNNGTTVTYPFVSVEIYDYQYDGNMFNDPQTDNNTKTYADGDTQAIFGSNEYDYFEPGPITVFPISNITRANPCVVTCPVNISTAPVGVGDIMCMFGAEGMTQINGLSAQVTAVSGGFGAWLITLALDTTSFSAYNNTPLVISAASATNPCTITLSSAATTHPLAGTSRDFIWIKNAAGGSFANLNQTTNSGILAVQNLRGSPGAWLADLYAGQFAGSPINASTWGTYTANSGSLTTGGLSVPFSVRGQTNAANTFIMTRGWSMNPISQMQGPPDAAGHGSGTGYATSSRLNMPSAPTAQGVVQGRWKRRRIEKCWTLSQTVTPGYLRIWDDGVLVLNYVGRTDNPAASSLYRNVSYGSVYHRDRGINNFVHMQNGYVDWDTQSGQCPVVYFTDQPTYAASTIFEPQPYITAWADGQIVISRFNQGTFADGATGYFQVMPGGSTVGTAVPVATQYTINPTSTPVITQSSLPSAVNGSAYSQVISATGGTPPYRFYLASSSTGQGVNATPCNNTWSVTTLSPTSCTLASTPTVNETDDLFIAVLDANSYNGGVHLPIIVGQPLNFQLATGHYVPSVMPPVVVNPRPDTETSSWERCRLAPNGINYRLPITIQGGSWPFQYVITAVNGSSTIPTGMNIGQTFGSGSYGVFNWANPVIGTYQITIQVTTQDYGRTAGSADPTGQVNVTFTLTVADHTDVTKFLYIDATNGLDTNNGAYATPVKTLAGFAALSSSGKQLCFMSGTYAFNSLTTVLDLTNRAKVWYNYTGAGVTIDYTGVWAGTNMYINATGPGVSMNGIVFNGSPPSFTPANDYYHVNSFGNRCNYYECTFQNFNGLNSSQTNFANWGGLAMFANSANHEYVSSVNNTISGFSRLASGGGHVWYSTKYSVIEGTTISGFNTPNNIMHGVITKGHNSFSTIRNVFSASGQTFGTAPVVQAMGPDGGSGDLSSNCETCWSFLQAQAPTNNGAYPSADVYGLGTATSWTGWEYRNTIVSGHYVLSQGVTGCVMTETGNILCDEFGLLNDSNHYTSQPQFIAGLTVIDGGGNVISTFANRATVLNLTTGQLQPAYATAQGITLGTTGWVPL